MLTRTVAAFAAALCTLSFPVSARPQTPIDAVRTARSSRSHYLGAGAFAALASGVAADLSLVAGRVVSERFLVGLEAGYSYRDESGEDEDGASTDAADERTVDHFFLDVVATWFPFWPSGAYLRGGIGFGTATEKWHDAEDWSTVVREHGSSGVGALLAAGWEFHVSEKLGLSVELGALARPGLDPVDPRFLLALTRYFGDRR